MATQAILTLAPVVRGDTMPGRQVTFSINVGSPTITSAVFRIENVLSLACTVNGAVVTIPAVAKATTAKWPLGVRDWDLQITVGGVSKTYLRGTIEILQSEGA